jgi:hypothetical protein
MAAWTFIDMVQVLGVVLQLTMVGPDMYRLGVWYRSALGRVFALFRRNRESNASMLDIAHGGADIILVLGVRDNMFQLEEGSPWGCDDLQARPEVDGLYRAGRGDRAGGSMPVHPEYVHLQYRQVIQRQNES